MAFDLATLIVIGCLLEGFTTKISSVVFLIAPTITFALLFTFLAVTRWNLWGLLVIPFLSVATWIGGMNSDLSYFASFYDWHVFISEMIGLTTIGLNVILFKIKGTKNVIKSIWMVLLMIVADYLIYCIVQYAAYTLCCNMSGDIEILVDGVKTHMEWVEEDGAQVLTLVSDGVSKINVCDYSGYGIIYNSLGLAVAVIGLLVLRSQGVLNNAIEKLIDDKKEAEFNNLNTNAFRISEQSEESEEKESSNDTSL